MSAGTYHYKEALADGVDIDLEELRKRVIHRLYKAAVDADQYPVGRPKLRIQGNGPFSFTPGVLTVTASVETL